MPIPYVQFIYVCFSPAQLYTKQNLQCFVIYPWLHVVLGNSGIGILILQLCLYVMLLARCLYRKPHVNYASYQRVFMIFHLSIKQLFSSHICNAVYTEGGEEFPY